MRKSEFILRITTIVVLLLVICKSNSYPQSDIDKKEITSEEQAEIIELICERFQKVYLYPEQVNIIRDSLNRKLVDGKYKNIKSANDFAFQLDKDIFSVTNDKHMAVMYSPQWAAELAKSSGNWTAEEVANLKESNYGFKELKILPSNVGYLDLRVFCPVRFAGETAVAAMNYFANCNALIIDLINNGGGEDDMVQFLISYLADPADSLLSFSTIYSRYKNDYYQSYVFPYVPGKKLFNIHIYILTSRSTFSAAEAFSFRLKTINRAIIIGENTRGGENPVEIQTIKDEYVLYIPAWKLVKSLTGSSIQWEGIGVKPDIEVESSEAFTTSYIHALRTLIDSSKTSEQIQKYNWAIEGIKLKAKPVNIDVEILKSMEGSYRQFNISYNNGSLYYQRGDRAKLRLIPVADQFFLIEGLDDVRLKFIQDKGKTKELQVYYDDGQIFTYSR
jgi:hypothetical protein